MLIYIQIEELGNVNFIFSDKTGTLTKNQLQFKYCIINTKYYQYFKSSKLKKRKKMLSNRKINKKKLETKTSAINVFKSNFMKSRRSNVINQINMSKKHMLDESSVNDNSDFISNNFHIFFKVNYLFH